MKIWISLAAAVVLAVTLTTPASPRTVKFETAVAVADQTDESLDRAIRQALETTVRAATAMGLTWIWLDRASLAGGAIHIRMVATDDEPAGSGDEPASQDTEPSDEAPVTL